jgi:hypothetical protein
MIKMMTALLYTSFFLSIFALWTFCSVELISFLLKQIHYFHFSNITYILISIFILGLFSSLVRGSLNGAKFN